MIMIILTVAFAMKSNYNKNLPLLSLEQPLFVVFIFLVFVF
jgi:hypothetical protein